ncbi:MAG: hypothetical protein GY716_10640 [bacterium]|nr:hypothetical protein [bacterium]
MLTAQRSIAAGIILAAVALIGSCDILDDDDSGDDPMAGRVVFLSSVQYAPDMMGLDGADQHCSDLAAAAGLLGSYKAWLADSTGSPDTRFIKSGPGYVRTDGALVADDWFDLTDGDLQNPISVDENGVPVTSSWNAAWSNVAVNGTARTPQASCMDWTLSAVGTGAGYVGDHAATDSTWTADIYFGCDAVLPLYCFQQ